jgi:hypothetical protein
VKDWQSALEDAICVYVGKDKWEGFDHDLQLVFSTPEARHEADTYAAGAEFGKSYAKAECKTLKDKLRALRDVQPKPAQEMPFWREVTEIIDG